MRKLKNAMLVLAVMFVSVLFFYVNAEAADVSINETNFPDSGFRAYVKKNFDKNKDGKLSTAEIKAVTVIDYEDKGCTNLKGIERFTSLTLLFCEGNKLTTLNLSKNTKLERLSCYDNKLTTLDLSKNTKLELIWCDHNKLTKLTLPTGSNLQSLRCNSNKLETVNIGKNPNICLAYHHPEVKDYYEGAYWQDYYVITEDDEWEDTYFFAYDKSTKVLAAPNVFPHPSFYSTKTTSANKKVSLKVEAKGTGLKYQWYYKKPGKTTWTKVSAAAGKKATYTFTAKASHEGYTYRCKVTNKYGTSTSGEIKLAVNVTPKVTSPTKDTKKTVAVGKTATFTVKATGASIYRWEYRTSETGTWKKVSLSSAKTASLKVTVKDTHNGYQYRCLVSNLVGKSVYSPIYTLKVK